MGGGSIGLLVSAYLAKEHEVSIYVRRKEQKEKINEHAIQLLEDNKLIDQAQVKVRQMEQMKRDHELYIICVKQTQLKEALDYFRHTSFHAPLLFLQNGMGHIKMLQQLIQPVYIGVVSHGAHRTSDYEVHHLGKGSISLASVTGNEKELKQLTEKLSQDYFPVQQVKNWERLLKDKLIVNAVINPLTALFDVPNGDIITNPHLHFLAKKLCEETVIALELSYSEAWEKVTKTAEITKDNVSSMRADVQARQATEVEAITGYIINQSPVELPYTNFVYHAVLALSKERI